MKRASIGMRRLGSGRQRTGCDRCVTPAAPDRAGRQRRQGTLSRPCSRPRRTVHGPLQVVPEFRAAEHRSKQTNQADRKQTSRQTNKQTGRTIAFNFRVGANSPIAYTIGRNAALAIARSKLLATRAPRAGPATAGWRVQRMNSTHGLPHGSTHGSTHRLSGR